MKGGRHACLIAALLPTCLLTGVPDAFGQGGRPEDNVLFPHPLQIPSILVGPDIGWGYWIDRGEFGVADRNLPCASFAEGRGYSLNAGARAFIHLSRSFFVSPRFRYEPRPADFTTPLAGEPIRNQTNEVVTLQQEAVAKGSFTVGCFDGMIGLDLFRTRLYMVGGGSVGRILSSGYDYTENILGPSGIVYDDTKTRSHTPAPDREFTTVNSLNASLRGGFGYIHEFGRFAINPEILYSRSLIPFLADPDAMDQQGFVVIIGVLWGITD